MGELEALERAGWEALSGAGGVEFYRSHMADDGLMVFPGTVMDKPTALATIKSVEPWARFELADVREVRTADVGVITYTATATRGGSAYRAVMSSVYVQREGGWLLLLHQQSPG